MKVQIDKSVIDKLKEILAELQPLQLVLKVGASGGGGGAPMSIGGSGGGVNPHTAEKTYRFDFPDGRETARKKMAALIDGLEADLRAALAASQAVEPDWIDDVIQQVAELSDINSPEGQPEMMLVSGAELRQILWGVTPLPSAPVAQAVEPDNTEGWESLAWALCAEEHGEEACTELIWEGGAIPEPWGDRWLKYEGEAKRLIALVAKHTHPAPTKPCVISQEHSDNAAVDKFADAMKDKLSQARDKGRGGWESCSEETLSKMLRDHVEKGDPRDVANFCMFIHTLGYRIAPAAPAKPLSISEETAWNLAQRVYGTSNPHERPQMLLSSLEIKRIIEAAHGIKETS